MRRAGSGKWECEAVGGSPRLSTGGFEFSSQRRFRAGRQGRHHASLAKAERVFAKAAYPRMNAGVACFTVNGWRPQPLRLGVSFFHRRNRLFTGFLVNLDLHRHGYVAM